MSYDRILVGVGADELKQSVHTIHERERRREAACLYVVVLRTVLVSECRRAELREECVHHVQPSQSCVEDVLTHPLLIVRVYAAVEDDLFVQ